MATPLTPAEAKKNKRTSLHPSMIEAVNFFLLEYDGNDLVIDQQAIINKFLELEPSYTESQIYKEKLLNIESTFRKHGWKVRYEFPEYDETGPSLFVFSEK